MNKKIKTHIIIKSPFETDIKLPLSIRFQGN